MPDRVEEARDAMLQIAWQGQSVSTHGRLRLTDHELLVEVGASRIRLAYGAIRGAQLQTGTLTVFSDLGAIAASESQGLEQIWVSLQARACALPELTAGLRALGSRHGGDAELQGRFFAPLLAARRRLEEQQDLEWRLVAFDADELRQRTTRVLCELVAERSLPTASARRSLEAQALDEAEGLYAALGALDVAADALRMGEDAVRFAAWREWASRARDVFTHADRCWLAVWPLLQREAVPLRGRASRWRWWREDKWGPGNAVGALAFLAGASYLGIG